MKKSFYRKYFFIGWLFIIAPAIIYAVTIAGKFRIGQGLLLGLAGILTLLVVASQSLRKSGILKIQSIKLLIYVIILIAFQSISRELIIILSLTAGGTLIDDVIFNPLYIKNKRKYEKWKEKSESL